MSAAPAPRYRMLAAFLFAVGVSLLQTVPGAACACPVALVAAYVSGASCKQLGRRLVPVNIFLLFLWLTLPLGFSDRPDVFVVFGPLGLHTTGVTLALCITLKANAIAICLLALLDSSSVTENARALLELRLPRKLVTLLLLTHAHLLRMRREYTNILHAAMLRGFVPSCSLRSLRIWAWLAAMLFVRSWQRSQAVSEAMKLRGFCGVFPLAAAHADTAAARLRGRLLVAGGFSVPVLLLACEF